ncbi:hypothetical protein [Aliterella atlantica]|uniref:Uncharacterized protein n=1 Tax=Aliterella atlantica CENA595 TaxID=1618023 RepID=A0A0D8ZLU9_9CYAN|nr:hypothetical protein [Aliterella atlantica]KJH69793.1 hypothetical protein UH38_22040 [Aliterella atlantica CENA595]
MQLMVIQDSDRTKIGSVAAQVGMELANGYKVSKVNDKSVIAQCNGHTEKFFDPTSIYYTEATRWGFRCSTVDEKVETLAALTRKFRYGESACQQYIDYGYASALSNRIEEAGFSFAKLVQKQREEAIAQLQKAEVVECSKK